MTQGIAKIKQEKLKQILQEKIIAIEKGEYEKAAGLRDQERKFLEENQWEQYNEGEFKFAEYALKTSGFDSTATWVVRHIFSEKQYSRILDRMNLEYKDERVSFFFNDKQIWVVKRINCAMAGNLAYKYILVLKGTQVVSVSNRSGDLPNLNGHEIFVELLNKIGWEYEDEKWQRF